MRADHSCQACVGQYVTRHHVQADLEAREDYLNLLFIDCAI